MIRMSFSRAKGRISYCVCGAIFIISRSASYSTVDHVKEVGVMFEYYLVIIDKELETVKIGSNRNQMFKVATKPAAELCLLAADIISLSFRMNSQA